MDIHLPNKNELSLYHVFDVLLVHLTLQNYFEVSSIFCLRRVCQLTKQLIDTDAIWMHLVKTWGIPTSPWAKLAHPCLSKLALFRDYCYLERHVFVNPQRPIESRYNQAYACQVKRIGFRPNCVFIEFCVRGDMSLGTLQSPTCSRLDYVVRDNIVHRKRPDRVIFVVFWWTNETRRVLVLRNWIQSINWKRTLFSIWIGRVYHRVVVYHQSSILQDKSIDASIHHSQYYECQHQIRSVFVDISLLVGVHVCRMMLLSFLLSLLVLGSRSFSVYRKC